MKNTSSTFLTRVRMARILFLFSVCFLFFTLLCGEHRERMLNRKKLNN